MLHCVVRETNACISVPAAHPKNIVLLCWELTACESIGESLNHFLFFFFLQLTVEGPKNYK